MLRDISWLLFMTILMMVLISMTGEDIQIMTFIFTISTLIFTVLLRHITAGKLNYFEKWGIVTVFSLIPVAIIVVLTLKGSNIFDYYFDLFSMKIYYKP